VEEKTSNQERQLFHVGDRQSDLRSMPFPADKVPPRRQELPASSPRRDTHAVSISPDAARVNATELIHPCQGNRRRHDGCLPARADFTVVTMCNRKRLKLRPILPIP
jgi:hypothetical protein